jgi:hypothetical protein
MRENSFQKKVIDEIAKRLPQAIVLKNDSSYVQGIPDLVVFYRNKYAMLEVKRSSTANHQTNQDIYISLFEKWGVFAAFVYPENFTYIMDDLVRYFQKG